MVYSGAVGDEKWGCGIYDGQGGDMGAEREHLDTVANELHALRRELDGLSYSTFPGEDKEKKRFQAVVWECEEMLWGVSDGIPFRKGVGLTLGPEARLMQEKMQGLLWEVCKMQCSQISFLQPIHEIRRLVDDICKWKAQAGARKEAKEAAEAEKKAAEAAAFRTVEAFASVTVVAG